MARGGRGGGSGGGGGEAGGRGGEAQGCAGEMVHWEKGGGLEGGVNSFSQSRQLFA